MNKKLKRHIISAVRVFGATFLSVISIAVSVMPTTGYKEFFVSTVIATGAAWFSAAAKWLFEAIFPNEKR